MDNQEELEKLIDKLMTLDGLESPSIDFTQKVVEKTFVEQSERFKYKPLLPKWILTLAAIIIIAFLAYGVNLYFTSGTAISYFKNLDKVGEWSSDFLAKFNFSKTLTYAIAISGLMICFHTLVLKKYFENRLA